MTTMEFVLLALVVAAAVTAGYFIGRWSADREIRMRFPPATTTAKSPMGCQHHGLPAAHGAHHRLRVPAVTMWARRQRRRRDPGPRRRLRHPQVAGPQLRQARRRKLPGNGAGLRRQPRPA